SQVMGAVRSLLDTGVIKRLGLVVRHRRLGYTANAMVVWDIPDERLRELAPRMAGASFVNLCYRRPRRPPVWSYNLFTMIHGRDRDSVLGHLNELIRDCGLEGIEHQVLFSRRCFKQRGAHYNAKANPLSEEKASGADQRDA
ncbi:MAG: AsnC family protein, partial [Gammaproteobacteria bacterium]